MHAPILVICDEWTFPSAPVYPVHILTARSLADYEGEDAHHILVTHAYDHGGSHKNDYWSVTSHGVCTVKTLDRPPQ